MALRDFALLILVCLLWGTNNVLSKVVVAEMHVPPLFYAAARFVLVLALVFPFLRNPPRPVWLTLLTGMLMGAGNFGLMFIALRTVSPSAAAIVAQLSLPLTIALSVAFLGERLTRRRLIGMVLALAGVIAVIWDPRGLALSLGLSWVVLGALCAAIGTVLMKKMPAGVKPMQLQAWVAVGSLPPMLGGSLLLEPGAADAAVAAGWPLAYALVFSAAIVSVFAHTQFYGLVRRYEANLVAPLTLMTPVFTIVLGIIFTGDHFGLRMALGAAAVLSGVLIVGVDRNVLTAAVARIRSPRA